MIANIFISKPIQIMNQCELISTIIVPVIIVNKIMVKIIGFISKGRY